MDVLSPIERYSLVDDAWAAVVAGTASAGSFLDLVQGFADETDLRVWQAILGGLGWLDRFVDDEPRERLRAFVRDLVRPALARLGWDASPDEPDLTRALRGQLVQSLAILGRRSGDPRAVPRARARGRGRSPAPAGSRGSGGRGGDEGRLRSLLAAVPSGHARPRRRSATCSRRRASPVTRRSSGSSPPSMTDDVRTQDAPYLLARSTTNRGQGPKVWRFIAEHWDAMQDRFASSNIIGLVSGIRYLTEPEAVAEVDAFFREHDIPQNHLMLQQGLERMRVERQAPRARDPGAARALRRLAEPSHPAAGRGMAPGGRLLELSGTHPVVRRPTVFGTTPGRTEGVPPCGTCSLEPPPSRSSPRSCSRPRPGAPSPAAGWSRRTARSAC